MSEYVETIEEQRRSLRDAFSRNASEKDKIVVSVSGIALGLSIAVLRDVGTHKEWKWVLLLAWIGFGFALVLVLLSLYLNAQQIKRSIDHIDVWLKDPPKEGEPLDGAYQVRVGERRFRTVDVVETVSIFSLIGGVVTVVIFVWLNS